MSNAPHAHSDSASIWTLLNKIIGIALVAFVLYFGAAFVLGGIKASVKVHGPKEAAASASAPAADAAPAPAAYSGPPAELTQKIDAVNPIAFATKEYTVKAGQLVKFTFDNSGNAAAMPHNVVIGKAGQKAALDAAAQKVLTDPQGLANGFIPQDPSVLANTKLLQGGQKETIEFTLPVAGDYPFICCFPGHLISMNGVIKAQ